MNNSKQIKETFYIFVGSSTESKSIAEFVTAEIEKQSRVQKIKLIPVPWYKYFDSEEKVINETFLDIFQNNILEKCDFSVFIISKDDMLIKRGDAKHTARDNIWLEAGIFIGKKGSKKTYFFLNDNDKEHLHFPTDLSSLTIPGVKWDSDTATLYFKKNKLFHKCNDIKKVVNNNILKQISLYCKKLVRKIIVEIKKPTVEKKATIITDRNECFKKGVELVTNAKERLYTTISFEKSLAPIESKEKQMLNALEKKIENAKGLSFKRFMNINHKGIQNQYNHLQKFIEKHRSSAELKEIKFDYLEIIISDNNVSLVFPDYRGSDKQLHGKVAFGLLVEDDIQLADIVSEWLMNKITKES